MPAGSDLLTRYVIAGGVFAAPLHREFAVLILERRVGNGINIGDFVQVEVSAVRSGGRVKLAVKAPSEVPVWRSELDGMPQNQRPADRALRVLVVEDDELFVDLLKLAFNAAGAPEPRFARSADETIGFLDSALGTDEQPDLILLDYHMPGENADSVLAWMLERPQDQRVPVVILSGDDSEERVGECLAAGASAFMHKSAGFRGLVSTVQRVLAFWGAPSQRA